VPKNWAAEQGSGPNLGRQLSQIRANSRLAQACSGLLRLAKAAKTFSGLHSRELRLLSHCSVLNLCMLRFENGMESGEVTFGERV
jgi:hypothetical protein